MFEHMAEYIDKLDAEAEDRLLTTKLVPEEIRAENGTAGCIVGVATGAFEVEDFSDRLQTFMYHRMGIDPATQSWHLVNEFNNACRADPIATAEFIRNRILENKAARELAETSREKKLRAIPNMGTNVPNRVRNISVGNDL